MTRNILSLPEPKDVGALYHEKKNMLQFLSVYTQSIYALWEKIQHFPHVSGKKKDAGQYCAKHKIIP